MAYNILVIGQWYESYINKHRSEIPGQSKSKRRKRRKKYLGLETQLHLEPPSVVPGVGSGGGGGLCRGFCKHSLIVNKC